MSKKTFSNEENIKKLLIEELIKNPQISKLISDLERAIVTLAAPIAKKILTNLVETINLEKIDTKTNSEKEEISQENRDFSELKDLTLRKYYNNKKRNGQPIEKDLNEELARRFPGYDKETQTFGNNNWSTVSDKSLRKAYRYRTIKNQPIEDELNEELAHRFPGYDKETHTFGNLNQNTENKDWTKLTDNNLRQTYLYRKNKNLPIEDELSEELARRFPGYDKETQTFGNNVIPQKRKNLEEVSDSAIRKSYTLRKKKGYPIEPALDAELVRRFPGYDKETKTFGNKKTRDRPNDWTKVKDIGLRQAYRYRINKNYPIEDELNEELARRFPGYDKEKHVFGKKVTLKYSNLKDNSLRKLFLNKIKKHLCIEDELNEELARRFPGYDKENKTFGNNNWSTISDQSLRKAYRYRINKNQPIEDELNEELARRFSGYNKETKTFGNNNWSNASIHNLRSSYKYRKNNNLPINDDLNEELARRFPGYDKETRSFGNLKTTINTENKDWTKLTDKNLRQTYLYRKSKNFPIEDGLSEELARRFPGYDKETKTFGHLKNGEKVKPINWSTAKNSVLRAAYKNRKINNQDIEESLNEELAQRFPNRYDKTKQTFVSQKQKSVLNTLNKSDAKYIIPLFSSITDSQKYSLFFDNGIQKINLLKSSSIPYELCLFDEALNMVVIRKKTEKNSNLLYIIDLNKGTLLSSFKLGGKIVRYSAKNHNIFYSTEYGRLYSSVLKPEERLISIPLSTEPIKADALKKYTIIIDKNGKETLCPIIDIKDVDSLDKLNNKILSILKDDRTENQQQSLASPEQKIKEVSEKPQIEPKPENKVNVPKKQPQKNIDKYNSKFIKKPKPVKAPDTQTNKDIIVSVKPIKITSDGFYNDVFINGKKILSNHIDTQIELFADDTILGIHGIVTNDSNYPTSPMWVVYDTEMRSRAPKIQQGISKYYVQVKNIKKLGDSICLELTNKSNCMLSIDRMKAIAKGKRFIIKSEKQK